MINDTTLKDIAMLQSPSLPAAAPTRSPVDYIQNALPAIRSFANDFGTGFSQAQNLAQNTPRITVADSIKNPIGRFAARIPQDIINSPSDLSRGAGKIAQDSVSGAILNPVTAARDIYGGLAPAATLVGTAYGVKGLVNAGKNLVAEPTLATGKMISGASPTENALRMFKYNASLQAEEHAPGITKILNSVNTSNASDFENALKMISDKIPDTMLSNPHVLAALNNWAQSARMALQFAK